MAHWAMNYIFLRQQQRPRMQLKIYAKNELNCVTITTTNKPSCWEKFADDE